MHGMPPGGSIPSYQTDTAWGGGGNGGMGGVFVRILSMLIYITHQQKFAVLYVWISCNAPRRFFLLRLKAYFYASYILSLNIGF